MFRYFQASDLTRCGCRYHSTPSFEDGKRPFQRLRPNVDVAPSVRRRARRIGADASLREGVAMTKWLP